ALHPRKLRHAALSGDDRGSGFLLQALERRLAHQLDRWLGALRVYLPGEQQGCRDREPHGRRDTPASGQETLTALIAKTSRSPVDSNYGSSLEQADCPQAFFNKLRVWCVAKPPLIFRVAQCPV